MKTAIRFVVAALGTTLVCITTAAAETAIVKYRGPVDLKPFACEWVNSSSVVTRLCYDARERYVIVGLQGTYYHYCQVPANVVKAWRSADSMGRFYNAQIKGNFDCRLLPAPAYAAR